MVVAGCVSSQGSESNRWYSVPMPTFVVPSEVIGDANGAYSWTPQWWWATSTSGVRDNCGGLPLPHIDHKRNTPSHLTLAGGAAQPLTVSQGPGK